MKRIISAAEKNSRFLYYVRNLSSLALPDALFRSRLPRMLDRLTEEEMKHVSTRAAYYNKLSESFDPGPDAAPFRFSLTRRQRNYAMDLARFTRYFDPQNRLTIHFGDITTVPDVPTIVKSRPINAAHENSVLFKLNKVRHFLFVEDDEPFERKIPMLVWRGNSRQENRKRFLSQYLTHPRCDVGHAHKHKNNEFAKPYLGIGEQLRYKYILSLEGHDVATNLKWIMHSNSLCFMPKPRHETWYMEGMLKPGVHYVEIRDDYADVEEKMSYYDERTEDALSIIRQANAYTQQFKNRRLEDVIQLLVLKKYFELSGQNAS